MQPEIIKFISNLTKRENRTPTVRIAKLFEEGGELAEAVLSFSSEFGRNEKGKTRSDILEEAADCFIVIMSILRSEGIDFSYDELEEMVIKKLKKWAERQQKKSVVDDKCPSSNNYPFEIHVTVEADPDVEHFKRVCASIGVKPLLIHLQLKDNSMLKDLMTSSIHIGDFQSARNEADRIRYALRNAGYFDTRVKIETVPWHPLVPNPSDLNHSFRIPKERYFESHLAIKLKSEKDKSILHELRIPKYSADNNFLHLSNNVFKKSADGHDIIMGTYRANDQTKEVFEENVKKIRQLLVIDGFEVEKEIVEFVIYDSKPESDIAWTGELN